MLLVLSLMGGTAVTLLLVYLRRLERDNLGDVDPEQLRQMREVGLTKKFGDAGIGKSLSSAPEIIVIVLVITIWLAPLVISLLGFDTVSADLQHRAVRYWSMRTRRFSYVVGKWLGLWATVSSITLFMHAIVWIVCAVRGEASVGGALGWGIRLWLVTLPMSAAWCALATLVSSFFKTPIVSLLVMFASTFALWLIWIIGTVIPFDPMTYVYPNHFDSFLLNPRADRFFTGLAACLGMTALYLGASSYFFQKRDL